MKALLLTFVFLLAVPSAHAVWASHAVFSPANQRPEDANSLRVRRGEDPNLIVRIPRSVSQNKGFFLIVCKERQPADALDFRPVLSQWQRHSAGERPPDLERIESIRPLRELPEMADQSRELILDPETAMRAYVVWDHSVIYDRGAMLRDGGLWITYDIPAFVEALEKDVPTLGNP